MMNASSSILGIDIGSVSIHMAVLSFKGSIVFSSSAAHHGEVRQCLLKMIQNVDIKQINYIAATDGTPSFVRAQYFYDDQLTIIRAAKHFHKDFDAILHIGGEKFSLSRFDKEQNYSGAKHNTSCAAGTGSFLDQQARRLNLFQGSEELSKKALSNTKNIPDIATRCAVFAKTDLIHAQQEGYGIEQICDGLCYGLSKNIVNTLFKFNHSGEKIIFCGGVSLNESVKKHLEKMTNCQFITDSNSKFYGAAGAAL